MFRELRYARLHMTADEFNEVYGAYYEFVWDTYEENKLFYSQYEADNEGRFEDSYDALYEAPQI